MPEAMAVSVRSITIGAVDTLDDESLEPARQLAASLTLAWRKKTNRGFFMRSEDFFNYAVQTKRLARELEEMADEFTKDGKGDWERAAGIARGQRSALVTWYGEDLNAQSHGESF